MIQRFITHSYNYDINHDSIIIIHRIVLNGAAILTCLTSFPSAGMAPTSPPPPWRSLCPWGLQIGPSTPRSLLAITLRPCWRNCWIDIMKPLVAMQCLHVYKHWYEIKQSKTVYVCVCVCMYAHNYSYMQSHYYCPVIAWTVSKLYYSV